jgi:hypothetical protein
LSCLHKSKSIRQKPGGKRRRFIFNEFAEADAAYSEGIIP